MSRIGVVGEHRALLGESPVWSSGDSSVYWVDIEGRRLFRWRWSLSAATAEVDADAPDVASWDLPGRPTFAALTEDPGVLVVGLEGDVAVFDTATESVQKLLTLEHHPRVRLNDARVDPRGRLWAGSMDEGERSDDGFPAGHLFRVDGRGSASTIVEGVATSNGLAFAPDGSTMYWTDTQEEVVWAFDYDVETGSLANRRAFFDFAPLPGKPDGACVDEDGFYWSACVYGWALVRISPGGDLDRVVDLPVEKPSMPAFVGPDLDTLVITSISTGGRRPASEGQPLAGGLLICEPGVRGLPEPKVALRGDANVGA